MSVKEMFSKAAKSVTKRLHIAGKLITQQIYTFIRYLVKSIILAWTLIYSTMLAESSE